MPSRSYVTNPKILLMVGKRIVNATDEAKYQHKVEIVNLVLRGIPPSVLCEFCPEGKNTITNWVKIADEKGFEALRPKKQTGRPPRLTAAQIKEIGTVLQESDPKAKGFDVWDGPSLSTYIKETYDVALCVRQCQRLLHDLDFYQQSPSQKRQFPGRR